MGAVTVRIHVISEVSSYWCILCETAEMQQEKTPFALKNLLFLFF